MCTRRAPGARHASASAATPSAFTASAGAGSRSAASTRLAAAAFTTTLGASAARRGADARVLLRYLGLIVAITIIQGVVRTFSRFVIFNVGRDIEYDLRNDLFRHLETLPLAFYQQRHTGDLMSRLVNDVTAVRMLLGPGILNFITTPVAYAYGLAFMLSSNVRPTLAELALYPLPLRGM